MEIPTVVDVFFQFVVVVVALPVGVVGHAVRVGHHTADPCCEVALV